MHRNSSESAQDAGKAGVVHAIYSTKGATRYFHGHCTSRAEADNLARALTLPPHGHDLAYVRRSPANMPARVPERVDRRSRPYLAAIDGRAVDGGGAVPRSS